MRSASLMLYRLDFKRMKEKGDVWFPTCEAVARHCLDVQPPNGGWN